MVVISGGVHRSGTTWLHNVLRLALPDHPSFFAEELPLGDLTQAVIKSHNWHTSFAKFTTVKIVRDLRYVAASLMRFPGTRDWFGINEDTVIDVLKVMVQNECEAWQEDILIKYEDGKESNIQFLFNKLSIDQDPHKVMQAVEDLALPTDKRDLVTELHPNHITNSHPSDLSDQTILKLESEFDWWFDKYEYKTKEFR